MKDQSTILREQPALTRPKTDLWQPARPQARIAELDGLRGIAILLVVAFHYIGTQLTNNTHPIARALYQVTSLGWVGVDLFFVLSGFLIGGILISQKSSKNYFSTFYMRRLVRIVPNYFLLLSMFAVVWYLPYFSTSNFLTERNEIPLWPYFLMLHNFFMAGVNTLGNDALSVTWSIGIEEQFYLLFPILVFFINLRWLPALLVTFIVGAVVMRWQLHGWIPKYVLLPARLDGLSIGFLVAYLNYKGIIAKYFLFWNKWLVILGSMLVGTCAYFYAKYGDLGVLKHTLFSVIFAIMLILALTARQTWYGKMLRNKVLMWVGAISYSLYLFHYFILGLAHHVAGKPEIGIAGIGDILITLVAFGLSLLFSWVVYQRLEKPMVAIGKRFSY